MEAVDLYKLPKDLLIKIILDVKEKFLEDMKKDIKLTKSIISHGNKCLENMKIELFKKIEIGNFSIQFSVYRNEIYCDEPSFSYGEERSIREIRRVGSNKYFAEIPLDWSTEDPEGDAYFYGDNLPEYIHPLVRERWPELKERLEKIFIFFSFYSKI